MCRICEDIEAAVKLDAEQTQRFLMEIGKAMTPSSPKLDKHFAKALDKLLGTGMSECNPELDEAWEKKRRSQA